MPTLGTRRLARRGRSKRACCASVAEDPPIALKAISRQHSIYQRPDVESIFNYTLAKKGNLVSARLRKLSNLNILYAPSLSLSEIGTGSGLLARRLVNPFASKNPKSIADLIVPTVA